MAISEHKTAYAHYTVEQWNDGPIANPAVTAYRIATDYDTRETWADLFGRFAEKPNAHDVEAVIVGATWGRRDTLGLEEVVETLVLYHGLLPNLRALFIGDITYDENEISWINQADLSPLFLAYPRLEHFGSRGSNGLRFGRLQHDHLRSFQLESGGTAAFIVNDLAKAHLPALTDFELWTGDIRYGWTGTLDDLRPFIMGDAFPHLTRLAICNCELADAVAELLVTSPLYPRLHEVDLSRGTLTNRGAQALLDSPITAGLKRLTIRHHFVSQEMVDALEGLSAKGLFVDMDAPQKPYDWTDEDEGRYVAVGE